MHTLSAHRETAGFILQTVIEELPKVEGLNALDTLKAESSASLSFLLDKKKAEKKEYLLGVLYLLGR